MIAGGIGQATRKSNTTVSSRATPRHESKETMPAAGERRRLRRFENGDDGEEEKKLDAVEKMVEEAKRKSSSANKTSRSAVKGGSAKNNEAQRSAAAKEAAGDDDGEDDDDGDGRQRRVDRLPDMTGKIISVSAEETLKLTKDKERKKTKRRGKENKEATTTDVEIEFQNLISRLSSKKEEGASAREVGGGAGDEDCERRRRPEAAEEEMPAVRRHHRLLHPPSKPSDDSEITNGALEKSAYISEYTPIINNTESDGRGLHSECNTFDTTSRTDEATRQKSEVTTTFLDHDITSITAISESAAVSESTQTGTAGLNDSDYGTTIYGKLSDGGDAHEAKNRATDNSGASPSRRRAHHGSLRSSIRRGASQEGDEGGGRPDYARGISWSTLIAMDSERRGGAGARRGRAVDRRADDRTGSGASDDGGRSKSTANSHGKSTGNSHRSEASGSKTSNSQRSVTWKVEGGAGAVGGGDPGHARRQAWERFERGVHYAERGKHAAARERFLIALRYRVVVHGGRQGHPDVAAAHEMLGHVNYCLSRKEGSDDDGDDDFEVSVARLDDGGGTGKGHGDSILGWDVTIENDAGGNGKKCPRKEHLEKAAMHYRAVLDILGGIDRPPSTGGRNTRNPPPAASDGSSLIDEDGAFRWADIADTYHFLGAENLTEIVARVRGRLDLLPASAASGGKSYARTNLTLAAT